MPDLFDQDDRRTRTERRADRAAQFLVCLFLAALLTAALVIAVR